jgi:hypothetical protein
MFYILPTYGVYVFCTDPKTNSVYFRIQHTLLGFYTPEMESVYCAGRSEYINETLRFVFVGDIPLCLKYINKIKYNMYSVWHN